MAVAKKSLHPSCVVLDADFREKGGKLTPIPPDSREFRQPEFLGPPVRRLPVHVSNGSGTTSGQHHISESGKDRTTPNRLDGIRNGHLHLIRACTHGLQRLLRKNSRGRGWCWSRCTCACAGFGPKTSISVPTPQKQGYSAVKTITQCMGIGKVGHTSGGVAKLALLVPEPSCALR
jgi:hypothetical protein